ncbi:uncharacterized protein [Amphiura filiformis]|uniref:uncharacterized protein n=1 Tax=Amphiura filiformis TaxID=82378 RepID=UPI003B2264CA
MMDSDIARHEGKQHDSGYIILSVILAVVFVCAMGINALAGAGTDIGWFKNDTGDISDAYYLEITPNGWAFSIWGIIYTWLILGIILILISICIKNQSGPVYLNPPIISRLFLVFYILDMGFNIAWLFLWDRQYMPWALAVFLAYDFLLYAMLFDHHRRLDRHLKYMQENHRVSLVLNRVIIQNGVALHGTWITIATLINLGVVVTYTAGAPQPTASTISLAILTCEVLAYFVLENFIWEKYLRYTFSVWPVVIWALSAGIDGNWDPEKVNSIFSAVLLALATVFLITKIVLSVVRCRTSPL